MLVQFFFLLSVPSDAKLMWDSLKTGCGLISSPRRNHAEKLTVTVTERQKPQKNFEQLIAIIPRFQHKPTVDQEGGKEKNLPSLSGSRR